MRRGRRIVLSIVAAAGSIVLVLVLVLLGSASEGPLSSMLRGVGSGVSRLESTLARRFRRAGRVEQLGWLASYRTDAALVRQPDTLLLGAYGGQIATTLEGMIELEEAIESPLALMHLYSAWGDAPDQAFPRRIAEAVRELGSLPVITWEPWLTTFENRLHPDLPLRADRDDGGLADITAGLYDFYIDAWAKDAARFGSPILVRLAHEMNDPYRYPWGPQNNQPQDFIAAWRHVVDRFRAAGADNVVWVWSPHVAYEGYGAYWPGDEYVDWVATGALNYGTVAYWSRWWTFREIFGRHYEFLVGLGKPIMIAEFGSLEVGGDRAEWYAAALGDIRLRHPAVRALLFFHVHDDATVTRQSVDWTFLDDPGVVAAVREGLRLRPEPASPPPRPTATPPRTDGPSSSPAPSR
jgi:hypothetical protein